MQSADPVIQEDRAQQPSSRPAADTKIADLESRVASLESRLARALADYENLEKRFGRESSAVVKFANASVLEKLLTVRDHLEMAAAHLKDASLTMILAQFDKVLAEEDVKEIDATGEFDPATMECQEQTAGEANRVVRVVQKGYILHDRVLRPARVVVGSGQLTESNSN